MAPAVVVVIAVAAAVDVMVETEGELGVEIEEKAEVLVRREVGVAVDVRVFSTSSSVTTTTLFPPPSLFLSDTDSNDDQTVPSFPPFPQSPIKKKFNVPYLFVLSLLALMLTVKVPSVGVVSTGTVVVLLSLVGGEGELRKEGVGAEVGVRFDVVLRVL